MAQMTEERLKSILASEIRQSTGYESDTIGSQRSKALAYYEGEREYELVAKPGRSSVVSRDVLEAVEWITPALMDIFTGNDGIVEFADLPGQNVANMVNEAIKEVVWQDNDGYQVIHDFAKDGLLSKLGVIKWYWETKETVETETLEGLDEATFIALTMDDAVEVVEHTEYDDPEAVLEFGADLEEPIAPQRHDVTIKRTVDASQLTIVNVPPEEFLVNRRARSIEDAYFVAHRVRRSYSDLISEGYSKEDVDKLPWGVEAYDITEEQEERWDDLDFIDTSTSDDKAQRKIWIYECFIEIDEDGDGIAELKRIVFGGGASNLEILDNEDADHKPFADWCPIRLPHRIYGLSMADLTMDLQAVNTALMRGALDSIYLANNPRHQVLDGKANLDDLLTSAPGGVVRVKEREAVAPLITVDASANAIGMMDVMRQIGTRRTGISEQTVGLSPEDLASQSATAAQLQSNSAQMRTKLIARNMAAGIKKLYMGIYKTLRKHSTEPKPVKINGQFVMVGPSQWPAEMPVRVTMTDNMVDKTRTLSFLGQIMTFQEKALMAGTPLTDMAKVYNALEDFVSTAEVGEVDRYFNQPQGPMPQKADPEAGKAQAEMQMKQAELQGKMQIEQMKAQQDKEIATQKAQQDAELTRYKAELQAQVDRERAAQTLEVEREKLAMQERLKVAELQAEAELERLKMAAGSRDGQGNIPEVL